MTGLVEAQQPKKVPRIGYLSASGPSSLRGSGSASFQREFRKLGYVEGKTIAFDYRYADNKHDRLPALADELVRLNLDVLVAGSTTAALAAKNATKTIPIVFFASGDPVMAGLVDSLARPGRNITGFTPALRRCWLANGWSYSRKPFPNSPAWLCCGIPEIQALKKYGRKAKSRRKDSVCSFTPWR
jgi:ABC transporter substrate binding protein